MCIISIDVGMKNLAYCIMKQDETQQWNTIIKWDIIDLCNIKPTIQCMGFLKNGKQCNKNAKYHKHKEFYCKLHAKKTKHKIPTKKMCLTRIPKLKLTDLKTIAKERDYIITNKPKKSVLVQLCLQDLEKNYFDCITNVDSRTINLVTYGTRIKDKFNKLLSNINITGVLIENQIGPIALRMKVLQGMIIQHFIENGCTNIKEISPSNKLKEFIGNTKTTYDERKKLSIKYTREILNQCFINNEKTWLEFFNTHKKKDDLADAFLQARWFFNNKKES